MLYILLRDPSCGALHHPIVAAVPLGLHLLCSLQVPHLSALLGTHEVHSCNMLVCWAHILCGEYLSV